ncbi:hypothetical protein CR513_32457, partial [Mucuna pruriens]
MKKKDENMRLCVVCCHQNKTHKGRALYGTPSCYAYTLDTLVDGFGFEVFINRRSLRHLLDQKELNMKRRKWLEFLKNYNFYLSHHLDKVKVVIDRIGVKIKTDGIVRFHDKIYVLDVPELRKLILERGHSSALGAQPRTPSKT